MSDGDSCESPARPKTESEFCESEEKERVIGTVFFYPGVLLMISVYLIANLIAN